MAAGLSAQAQAMPASIPVVDIGALWQRCRGQDGSRRQIGAACDDIGFFYVVNHNVPVGTIDHAVAMADNFFKQPETERLKVKSDKNNRGYREVGDVVHRNGKPSARDNFDIGFPVTEDDPEVKAGTPLYAPNIWPDMPGFREAIEAYYGETFTLGMKILEGFALYLGKPADFFTQHFTKPVADMVINHYLGAAGLHISDRASGPHTDHGIVTILWQDSVGGLEVMGKDGQWIGVTPLRGSYVINIGELMKRWTNGASRRRCIAWSICRTSRAIPCRCSATPTSARSSIRAISACPTRKRSIRRSSPASFCCRASRRPASYGAPKTSRRSPTTPT
jgi:isopenicillin N synthase-like dioxygenase